MTVSLAVTAAALYGAADFLGGLASRRLSTFAVVVWSQVIGVVVLAFVLAATSSDPAVSDIGWGALAGLAGAFGIVVFYQALATKPMGVVAPVTALGATAVPVAAGLVLGEELALLGAVGGAVSLLAVVLIGQEGRGGGVSWRGVTPAILAGLLFGIFVLLLHQTSSEAGLWPLLAARFASLSVLVPTALLTGHSLRVDGAAGWRIVAASGVLDMLANVLYLVAIRHGLLTLVAVLVSLYPAGTVLLARVVLGEHLHWIQLVGLGMAAVGVSLLALA